MAKEKENVRLPHEQHANEIAQIVRESHTRVTDLNLSGIELVHERKRCSAAIREACSRHGTELNSVQ